MYVDSMQNVAKYAPPSPYPFLLPTTAAPIYGCSIEFIFSFRDETSAKNRTCRSMHFAGPTTFGGWVILRIHMHMTRHHRNTFGAVDFKEFSAAGGVATAFSQSDVLSQQKRQWGRLASRPSTSVYILGMYSYEGKTGWTLRCGKGRLFIVRVFCLGKYL